MKVTIVELFNFIKSENIDLTKEDVCVNTRNGYKRVHACEITDNSRPVIINLDNGYHLICSKKHKVKKANGFFILASNLKTGDTIQTDQGIIPVASKINLKDYIDLYDLQVDGEEYYTNGIVSHNSTIVESIKLGLYGKSSKPLKSVHNRYNGHGEINVGLNTNNKVVNIDRNFAPNKLSLFVDGELFDVAAKKDVQKYIEEELLDLPYYVFNNIITLSLADFKSFLSMTPADKRLIIDRIFSLSVLNDMKDEVKLLIKACTNDKQKIEYELSNIERNIQKYENEIQELKRLSKINNDAKIEGIKNKINSMEEERQSLLEPMEKLETNIEKLDKAISENRSQLSDYKSELNRYNREIRLYDEGKCGTCGSDLTTGDHVAHKNKLEKDILDVTEKMNDINVKYEALYSKQKKVDEKLSEYRKKNSDYVYELRTLNKELQSLKSEKVDDTQTLTFERMLEESNTNKTEIESKIEKLESKIKFYNVAEKMLGEKGVKQLAIANIVPSLNDTINEYLEVFERGLVIEFDEDFECKIYDRGLEVETHDLSLGEHKIMDFVVLVTIIKLLKTKYLDLNIIFLDEIFASISPENVERVLSILKKVSRELKLNIFVIHHSILDSNIFDKTIKVTKDKLWSSLEII